MEDPVLLVIRSCVLLLDRFGCGGLAGGGFLGASIGLILITGAGLKEENSSDISRYLTDFSATDLQTFRYMLSNLPR